SSGQTSLVPDGVPAGGSPRVLGSHRVNGALGESLPRVTTRLAVVKQSTGIRNISMVGVTAWTSASICWSPMVMVTRFARPTVWFCVTTFGFSGEHGSLGSPAAGVPPAGADAVPAAPSLPFHVP